jgi:hypothetical protein
MTDVEELTERVDGIVHEDTQLHEAGLDLTVAEVYDIDRPGEIDFGGDELEAAVSSPHETNLRDPDDDYAWWELGAGTYLLEYNEGLASEEPLVCQPRSELLERGGTQPDGLRLGTESDPAVGPTGRPRSEGKHPGVDATDAGVAGWSNG